MDPPRVTESPESPLARIADAALQAADGHPESCDDMRVLVLVTAPPGTLPAGIPDMSLAGAGYETRDEVLTALLGFAEMAAAAAGAGIQIVEMGRN